MKEIKSLEFILKTPFLFFQAAFGPLWTPQLHYISKQKTSLINQWVIEGTLRQWWHSKILRHADGPVFVLVHLSFLWLYQFYYFNEVLRHDFSAFYGFINFIFCLKKKKYVVCIARVCGSPASKNFSHCRIESIGPMIPEKTLKMQNWCKPVRSRAKLIKKI